MSVSNVMWVEKYRPKKISDLVNQKEIMGSLNALLKNQSEMPHLLFRVQLEWVKPLQQFAYQEIF